MTDRAPARGSAGFTLLELLVVLALIGIVSALAFPRTGAVSARAAFHAEVGGLVQELRSARIEALKTNAPQRLTIDLTRRMYWSTVREQPNALRHAGALSASGSGIEQVGDQLVGIRFSPEGRAGQATIQLRTDREAAIISVDWLTGAIALAWTD